RRLAGAVGTDDDLGAAREDLERDPVERAEAVERDVDVVEREQRLSHGSPPPRRPGPRPGRLPARRPPGSRALPPRAPAASAAAPPAARPRRTARAASRSRRRRRPGP